MKNFLILRMDETYIETNIDNESGKQTDEKGIQTVRFFSGDSSRGDFEAV